MDAHPQALNLLYSVYYVRVLYSDVASSNLSTQTTPVQTVALEFWQSIVLHSSV